MQSDWKEIYKITAERTKEPEQLYKDLGNFVFSKLYSNLRRPKSLIIKLKGVGTWYLRKKKMQEFKYPKEEKILGVDFILEVNKYQNRLEMWNIFQERLKEYEEFLKIKQEIRKARNEVQGLLEPFTKED